MNNYNKNSDSRSEFFYIAAYGSLRSGQYNFCKSEMFPVCLAKVEGYDLFDLGAYPCVYPGNNSVVVEVLQVNRKTKNWVDNMEFGAGYKEVVIPLSTPLGEVKASLYVYKRSPIFGEFIKSGDWSDYLKDIKNGEIVRFRRR